MSNRNSCGVSARRLAALTSLLAQLPRELSFRDAVMCPEPEKPAIPH